LRTNPRNCTFPIARPKVGLAVVYNRLLACTDNVASQGLLTPPSPSAPPPSSVCRWCRCGVLPCVHLSWRQRGHGGGAGRRLVHRAARPQLRGGRPPPAPQCPMTSRSQLLCCPSVLTSPQSSNRWWCSTGGAAAATAQVLADATALNC